MHNYYNPQAHDIIIYPTIPNAFYTHYNNNNLHSLNSNSIGDDGLHALSLPIKNYCKELRELRLVNTSFPIILIYYISMSPWNIYYYIDHNRNIIIIENGEFLR